MELQFRAHVLLHSLLEASCHTQHQFSAATTSSAWICAVPYPVHQDPRPKLFATLFVVPFKYIILKLQVSVPPLSNETLLGKIVRVNKAANGY